MPDEHANLSPSAADRWFACPGSIAASEGLSSPSSPAAQLGTAAHTLAEWCLTEERVARERIGDTITNSDGSSFEVTEEMAANVQGYADLCYALKTNGLFDTPVTAVEQRIKATEHIWGTGDFRVTDLFGDHMEIADYKNGRAPVTAEGNRQQMCYALGAYNTSPSVRTIGINIYQPNASDVAKAGAHRRHFVTVEELLEWRDNELLPAEAAALKSDAPRKAGSHCKYCPALALCPVPTQASMAKAELVFDPVQRQVELPAPENMKPEQIGKVLEALPLLRTWLDGVEKFAKSELLNGGQVPGWKMVEGRRTNKWSDEAAAESLLETNLGDAAFKKTLLTVAAARKAAKGNADLEEAIDAIVTTSRSPSLASIDDKRPALEQAKPETVFDSV